MTNSNADVKAFLEAHPTKHYKCHKEVDAAPCSRGHYNSLRGWTVPADENPADAGYLVIYSKGTADEYVSWSPKKQLEEGYSEVTDAI